jgi:hypothetical protein
LLGTIIFLGGVLATATPAVSATTKTRFHILPILAR